MDQIWYNVLINIDNDLSIKDVPYIWRESVIIKIETSYKNGIIDRMIYSKAMSIRSHNIDEPASVDDLINEYL